MARKPQQESQDSADLHAAIESIIDSYGRGGLSFVAKEVGMTRSALRKRLLRPETAFDAPTLRAAILVMEMRRATRSPEPAADTPAQQEPTQPAAPQPDHR